MTKIEERIAIARPAEDVYQLLTHEEPEWLLPFLRIAAHNGEQAGFDLRARLRGQPRLRSEGPKTMVISVGNAIVDVEGGSVEIPFHWEPGGYKSVFPSLDGHMRIRTVAEGNSELILDGDYTTPAPVSGDLDDTLVAHHAAQTAVKDLLTNLRSAIEESSRKDLVDGTT